MKSPSSATGEVVALQQQRQPDPPKQPLRGRLEGLQADVGLVGWLQSEAPAMVVLTLEDLLQPGQRWKLAELKADRPRPDLRAEGIHMDCGFAFLGHNGRDLPPRSSGMVVRAFEQRADDRFELPGSPLRVDAERYNQLRRLCRIGLGRDACLGPVRGAYLAGWATGAGPYRICIDGGKPWSLTPPTSPQAHEWPLQFTLPAQCCEPRRQRAVNEHAFDHDAPRPHRATHVLNLLRCEFAAAVAWTHANHGKRGVDVPLLQRALRLGFSSRRRVP